MMDQTNGELACSKEFSRLKSLGINPVTLLTQDEQNSPMCMLQQHCVSFYDENSVEWIEKMFSGIERMPEWHQNVDIQLWFIEKFFMRTKHIKHQSKYSKACQAVAQIIHDYDKWHYNDMIYFHHVWNMTGQDAGRTNIAQMLLRDEYSPNIDIVINDNSNECDLCCRSQAIAFFKFRLASFDLKLTIETFWQFIYNIEYNLLQQRCMIHRNIHNNSNDDNQNQNGNNNCEQQYFIHQPFVQRISALIMTLFQDVLPLFLNQFAWQRAFILARIDFKHKQLAVISFTDERKLKQGLMANLKDFAMMTNEWDFYLEFQKQYQNRLPTMFSRGIIHRNIHTNKRVVDDTNAKHSINIYRNNENAKESAKSYLYQWKHYKAQNLQPIKAMRTCWDVITVIELIRRYGVIKKIVLFVKNCYILHELEKQTLNAYIISCNGNFKKAEKLFKPVIKHLNANYDPFLNGPIYFAYCLHLMKHKKSKLIRKYFLQTLETSNTNGFYYYYIAMYFYSFEKDYSQSLFYLRLAWFVNPTLAILTENFNYYKKKGQLKRKLGGTMICGHTKCNVELNEQSKRCSGCKSVNYCSRKCQKLDWKTSHKRQCIYHTIRHFTPKQMKFLDNIETLFASCES